MRVSRSVLPRAAGPPRPAAWSHRLLGAVLGGLAGAFAAYTPEIWSSLDAAPEVTVAIDPAEGSAVTAIPAPDSREAARQFAHSLIARARDLIARGEIREAERFLSAAEQLEADPEALLQMRRLLDVAKAKIDLAQMAPASGPEAARPESAPAPPAEAARAEAPPPAAPSAAATPPGPAASFAEGVRQFRARDYDAAFAAFAPAAEAGHPAAQNYLGYMYRHGLGVRQDYAKALAWYHKAAEQNHAGAQNNIGYMYRHGLGVDRDLVEARGWFRRAGERGDAAAQFNLGQMAADGIGAPADYREAIKWYSAAAQQGHARAALELATLYAQGLGVSADASEAYFWYGVAVRGGADGAARLRRALAPQLSSYERQAADSRLAGWKTQNADGEAR